MCNVGLDKLLELSYDSGQGQKWVDLSFTLCSVAHGAR